MLSKLRAVTNKEHSICNIFHALHPTCEYYDKERKVEKDSFNYCIIHVQNSKTSELNYNLNILKLIFLLKFVSNITFYPNAKSKINTHNIKLISLKLSCFSSNLCLSGGLITFRNFKS